MHNHGGAKRRVLIPPVLRGIFELAVAVEFAQRRSNGQ